MGGDGGTLNNSRHEHTRLRQSILGRRDASTEQESNRQRASTTHCALTKEELQPGYVVVDRLGQLYNKEALLRHLIHRQESNQTNCNDDDDNEMSHIVSVRKDTVSINVQQEMKDGVFLCPVTKRCVTAEGGFSVQWPCGCIVSDAIPKTVSTVSHNDDVDGRKLCPNCNECVTNSVALGLSFAKRRVEQIKLIALRKERKKNKKKRKVAAQSKDNNSNNDKNKVQRLESTTSTTATTMLTKPVR